MEEKITLTAWVQPWIRDDSTDSSEKAWCDSSIIHALCKLEFWHGELAHFQPYRPQSFYIKFRE